MYRYPLRRTLPHGFFGGFHRHGEEEAFTAAVFRASEAASFFAVSFCLAGSCAGSTGAAALFCTVGTGFETAGDGFTGTNRAMNPAPLTGAFSCTRPVTAGFSGLSQGSGGSGSTLSTCAADVDTFWTTRAEAAFSLQCWKHRPGSVSPIGTQHIRKEVKIAETDPQCEEKNQDTLDAAPRDTEYARRLAFFR
jgi:hypothetical protein